MSYAPLPATPGQFLVLQGRTTTVILEIHPDEAPLWRYWGPALPAQALPPADLRDVRPLPSFMLDFDQPLTVAPTFGVGWFGQSALLAHRAGQAFAQAYTSLRVEWQRPGEAVVLHLTDPVAEVQLELHLHLDPATDALTLRTRLHNAGSTALDVQWLAAATLPLPG